MGGRTDERFDEPSRSLEGIRWGEPSNFDAPNLLPLDELSILLVPELTAPTEAEANLREALFDLICVAEALLEAVDCDQRFRFPIPSLTLPMLSDRPCEATWRLRVSGDVGARSE
jgi:hypothetical protein